MMQKRKITKRILLQTTKTKRRTKQKKIKIKNREKQ